jgi:hypothetical protein
MTMKKVLIIAYHFPPDAGIGAVRPAKFAKYLPEFGWEPIVYTLKKEYYEACDHSKLEEFLGTTRIFRVKPIPGPLQLYSRIFSSNHRVQTQSGFSQDTEKKEQTETGSSIKKVLSSLLRVPEDKQGWILNIVKDCYRIVKKHRIDVFLTSGPPMSSHLGGALLKKLTGAIWVADFRDPWWGSLCWMGSQFRSHFSDSLTKRLEASVVKNADLVISTAPTLTEYFRTLLPVNQQAKCVTITNGFDENDFAGIEQGSQPLSTTRIRIIHAGSLYAGRNPEPFFAALHNLIHRGELIREDMEIEFIGSRNEYNGISLTELIRKHDLSKMVTLSDSIPHRACLERLMGSHGLLLFAQDFAEQIPAKIFEYMRVDRPLFALVTDGDAKRILEFFPNAFMADPHVAGHVEEKLLQMIKAIKGGNDRLSQEKKGYIQFDRKELTRELAGLLNQKTML